MLENPDIINIEKFSLDGGHYWASREHLFCMVGKKNQTAGCWGMNGSWGSGDSEILLLSKLWFTIKDRWSKVIRRDAVLNVEGQLGARNRGVEQNQVSTEWARMFRENEVKSELGYLQSALSSVVGNA